MSRSFPNRRHTFGWCLPVAILVTCLGMESGRAAHYRVYLLGGQSNANGRGDASQLSAPFADPQADVRFYWHRSQSVTNAVWLVEDQWIALAPGSGHGTTLPVFAKEFGSEVSFGRAMADATPGVQIAIIKYTHGGTNLHTQWSPTGEMYANFKATAQAALDALENAGDTYEFGGMIWHQGESDTGSAADAYETNLSNLIARVRQDVFEGQRMPFVVGGISDSQYGSQITTPGTGSYKVRQAQESVATNGVQTGFANTDGFPVRPTDTIHFDHNGQIALGQAFAAEMLRLEANDPDRDGLLNEEEALLGTRPDLADTDRDGQDDGVEVRAGTDPNNDASFFAITRVQHDPGQVSLEWPSRDGNTYRVEVSTNLTDWILLETGIPGNGSGTHTQWATPYPFFDRITNGTPVAVFNAQTGNNGNFNTDAFDTAISNAGLTVSRMFQGGSLTGGGASAYVLANALFDSSNSGSPGFNFADAALPDVASAAAAGDWAAFTVQGQGHPITYSALEFYTDQFGTTAQIDVSYTLDGVETFVLQGMIPPGNNAPVALATVDFPDFTTDQEVRWTFTLYGAASSTQGTRLDDITLHARMEGGTGTNTTYLRLGLLP